MGSFAEFLRGLWGCCVVKPPSIAEWEQGRKASTTDLIATDNPPEKLLAGISPLSLTCFAESIDPEDLSLSVERLQVVKRELARIARVTPLEAYVACLEGLRVEGVEGFTENI
jgi:hypothetical protein